MFFLKQLLQLIIIIKHFFLNRNILYYNTYLEKMFNLKFVIIRYIVYLVCNVYITYEVNNTTIILTIMISWVMIFEIFYYTRS